MIAWIRQRPFAMATLISSCVSMLCLAAFLLMLFGNEWGGLVDPRVGYDYRAGYDNRFLPVPTLLHYGVPFAVVFVISWCVVALVCALLPSCRFLKSAFPMLYGIMILSLCTLLFFGMKGAFRMDNDFYMYVADVGGIYPPYIYGFVMYASIALSTIAVLLLWLSLSIGRAIWRISNDME